jgi:F0F1-type ATP synthase assembly protein I
MTDDENRDGRSAMARGYVLASRASSIGLQMAIPAAVGWWVDSQWKTTPGFLIAGVVLGFVAAMFELVKLARDSEQANSKSRGRRSDKNQEGGPR